MNPNPGRNGERPADWYRYPRKRSRLSAGVHAQLVTTTAHRSAPVVKALSATLTSASTKAYIARQYKSLVEPVSGEQRPELTTPGQHVRDEFVRVGWFRGSLRSHLNQRGCCARTSIGGGLLVFAFIGAVILLRKEHPAPVVVVGGVLADQEAIPRSTTSSRPRARSIVTSCRTRTR